MPEHTSASPYCGSQVLQIALHSCPCGVYEWCSVCAARVPERHQNDLCNLDVLLDKDD